MSIYKGSQIIVGTTIVGIPTGLIDTVNGKADSSTVIILENKVNNRYIVAKSAKALMPSWWVEYNDGWCEQGGNIHVTNNISGYSISFAKEFVDLNYNFNLTPVSTSVSTNVSSGQGVRTTASIIVNASQAGASTANTYASWQACGYIS